MLTFVVGALALHGFVTFPHAVDSLAARLIASYVHLVAHASALLIRLFDEHAQLTAGELIVARFPLRIVLDCSALDLSALYLAAVLVYPAPVGLRLLGVALGLGFIALANLTRILLLYLAGVHLPRQFDFLHEDLMTLLMVAATALAFVAFAALAARRAPL